MGASLEPTTPTPRNGVQDSQLEKTEKPENDRFVCYYLVSVEEVLMANKRFDREGTCTQGYSLSCPRRGTGGDQNHRGRGGKKNFRLRLIL